MYRIETWESSREIHYTDALDIQQVKANLFRSGDAVRLAVLEDLDKGYTGTYIDFADRTFTVVNLTNS